MHKCGLEEKEITGGTDRREPRLQRRVIKRGTHMGMHKKEYFSKAIGLENERG